MKDKRIIIPLDNMSIARAHEVIKQTKNEVWGYKVRKLILDHGLQCLDLIKEHGKIMVDFKHYDIPMAMKECVAMEILSDVDITTVHMSADWESPLELAPYIAGVTILTSMQMDSYAKWYHMFNYKLPIHKMIKKMTKQVIKYNYGYIVCSANDLEEIKNTTIKKICPGIRPKWSVILGDDQNRITTPSQAIKNGADLLVIGRPILQSKNILDAVKRINNEINETLHMIKKIL